MSPRSCGFLARPPELHGQTRRRLLAPLELRPSEGQQAVLVFQRDGITHPELVAATIRLFDGGETNAVVPELTSLQPPLQLAQRGRFSTASHVARGEPVVVFAPPRRSDRGVMCAPDLRSAALKSTASRKTCKTIRVATGSPRAGAQSLAAKDASSEVQRAGESHASARKLSSRPRRGALVVANIANLAIMAL